MTPERTASRPPKLVMTPLQGIPMIRSGDDLVGIIGQGLAETEIRLKDGDILVLAQKIVSKAEDRKVDLRTIAPGREAQALAEQTHKDPRVVELILRESNEVIRTRPGLIVVEHRCGFICANAGIDHSNVLAEGGETADWVLLLPENPDASANRIRAGLEDRFGVRIGLMIIDSHGRAWRLGTTGITIGVSGVPGLVDMRGKPDLFDYQLRVTEIGAADELAAGASLMMGQAAEGTPVIHVRGFPYPLREASLSEILRPKETDLFR
jgi:coenzyme F420-0:L-glutamate ligase/coenzyme F420-1:gamma-L-glutamate ligase